MLSLVIYLKSKLIFLKEDMKYSYKLFYHFLKIGITFTIFSFSGKTASSRNALKFLKRMTFIESQTSNIILLLRA